MKQGDSVYYLGEKYTILSIDQKNYCKLKRNAEPELIELARVKDIRDCQVLIK